MSRSNKPSGQDANDNQRARLWELIEQLDDELTKPCPDWERARESARELWERIAGYGSRPGRQ